MKVTRDAGKAKCLQRAVTTDLTAGDSFQATSNTLAHKLYEESNNSICMIRNIDFSFKYVQLNTPHISHSHVPNEELWGQLKVSYAAITGVRKHLNAHYCFGVACKARAG